MSQSDKIFHVISHMTSSHYTSLLWQILRLLLEIKLRLCFQSREFILSDDFLFIVCGSFKNIIKRSKNNKHIAKSSKNLFNLFLMLLLTKLVGKCVITLFYNSIRLIAICKEDIEDFYICFIDLVEILWIFFYSYKIVVAFLYDVNTVL